MATWSEIEENKDGRFLKRVKLYYTNTVPEIHAAFLTRRLFYFHLLSFCIVERATVCLMVYERQHSTLIFLTAGVRFWFEFGYK